jgi:hypothetical protein
VDAFEQVTVAVEEGAVDSGAARRAMLVTLSSAPSLLAASRAERMRWRRLVESARRPSIIASTAGVMLVVMGFAPGAGRAGVGGCEAC